MSVAWFGLNQVSWNFTRSARVTAFTDVSVPAAGERLAVRVAGAVEQQRQHAQAHRERLHLLLLDVRQRDLLHAIEIALRERRVEDDVGEERQRRIELVLERRHRHAHLIEPAARREVRAERRELVGDLRAHSATWCLR